MKTTATIILAVLGCSAFAGERTVSLGKSYKQPAPEECFGPQELQIDFFGQYYDGNSPFHAGPVRDHGWGGGVGINKFFNYNLGFGVDASWVNAEENASLGSDETVIHHYSASLIYRWPIQDKCIAPYIYVGGGVACDGESWGFGHAGLGVEFRLKPQKLGIFIDGRWTYYGDRFNHGDQNNIGARVGLRWVIN